ncbi:hypothetical protein [Lederbergia lenta]|uniref:hypothetical protein n=1 Tax=Lederbergia lenta TaxID=1467 RepID=UPI00203BAF55|nr:hypothetical protein [Lederbergia lenta]MCM3110048.1 hypothetical protein [Lederbergia lenta]
MGEELKIQVVGSLNAGKTIGEINTAIKGLEKKINQLNLKIKVDDKVLNTIKQFNNELRKIEPIATNAKKVIEEVINPDGSRTKRTYFDGLKGEFSEVTKAAKKAGDTQRAQVDSLKDGFDKATKSASRFNAEQKKISESLKMADKDGVNTRNINMDGKGNVTGYTDTYDPSKELKLKEQAIKQEQALIEQMSGFREQSNLRRLADDKKLAENQHKAINLNNEQLRQEKEKLELFKKNYEIDARKLMSTHSKTADTSEIEKSIAHVKSLDHTMPNVNRQIQDAKLGMKQFRAEASEAARSSMTMGEAFSTAMVNFAA